jgi:hypothetical protein
MFGKNDPYPMVFDWIPSSAQVQPGDGKDRKGESAWQVRLESKRPHILVIDPESSPHRHCHGDAVHETEPSFKPQAFARARFGRLKGHPLPIQFDFKVAEIEEFRLLASHGLVGGLFGAEERVFPSSAPQGSHSA